MVVTSHAARVALKTRLAWTPSELAYCCSTAADHQGSATHHLELFPSQLIIFMALAKGRSRIRTGAVTLHTQTAIHIAEQLTQVCVSWSTWG